MMGDICICLYGSEVGRGVLFWYYIYNYKKLIYERAGLRKLIAIA